MFCQDFTWKEAIKLHLVYSALCSALIKRLAFLLLLRTFEFCYFTSGNDLSFIVLLLFL